VTMLPTRASIRTTTEVSVSDSEASVRRNAIRTSAPRSSVLCRSSGMETAMTRGTESRSIQDFAKFFGGWSSWPKSLSCPTGQWRSSSIPCLSGP
jgi:hypothetical protein